MATPVSVVRYRVVIGGVPKVSNRTTAFVAHEDAVVTAIIVLVSVARMLMRYRQMYHVAIRGVAPGKEREEEQAGCAERKANSNVFEGYSLDLDTTD
jgi:hypothetical protein